MRVGLEIVQGQSVAFAVMIAIWAAPDRQFQNALRTPLRRSCENAFRIITEMPAHPAEVEVVKSACIDLFKASAGQYLGHVHNNAPLFHPLLREQRSRIMSARGEARSEEHTSELQSLMRISYAVFCLKKKKNRHLCTETHKHLRQSTTK